jgi:hypothetical protein
MQRRFGPHSYDSTSWQLHREVNANTPAYNRRSVGRGLIATCIVLLAMFVGPATGAFAAADVRLQRAVDGTLLVVGSGWRPGDKLEVSLGKEQFTTYVDHAGDFEVATGLATYQGDLSVHHPSATVLPAPGGPNPMAVLFVHGIAEGSAFLGALIGVGALALGAHRWMRGA